MKQLFAVKSLDRLVSDTEEPTHQLKRTLGPVQLTALGIGAIIGAGIFSSVGTAAAGGAEHLGRRAGARAVVRADRHRLRLRGALLRRVRGDGAGLRLGLHLRLRHARRAGRLDHRLGPDHRVRDRQRRGGDLLVGLLPGAAARASASAGPSGWASTTAPRRRRARELAADDRRGRGRRPSSAPWCAQAADAFATAPHIAGIPIIFNLPAFLIVALITWVLVRGIRESAWFNIGDGRPRSSRSSRFFIIVGAFYVKPENWTPFAPNGFHGISSAAAIIFFAYIGFDAVSTAAEETQEPAARHADRDHRPAWSSARSSTSLVAVVLTGHAAVEPAGHRRAAGHRLLGARHALGRPASSRSARCSPRPRCCSCSSSASRASSSRWRATACCRSGRRRCTRSTARRTSRPSSPACVVAVFAGVRSTSTRSSSSPTSARCSPSCWWPSAWSCCGVPTRTGHRPFRTPFVPLVPLLAVIMCTYLMIQLPWVTWVRFAIWLAARPAVVFRVRRPPQRAPARERAGDVGRSRRLDKAGKAGHLRWGRRNRPTGRPMRQSARSRLCAQIAASRSSNC